MNISKIYELEPQMKTYGAIGYDWKPFIMHIQQSNFRSRIVNTDNFGLRFNDQEISNSIFDEKGLIKKKFGAIVGASAVFGVGSTLDKYTIPSFLTKNTELHYYNLGGRGYCGFQEIIFFNSLIKNLKKIQQVIIFSGVNDIFMNIYINNYDKILGPMFYTNEFKEKMKKESINWKKKLKQQFVNFFSKSNLSNEKLEINTIEDIFKIIKRNLISWATIKNGMNVKLFYFLQPTPNWCKKELSNEEDIIFKELDKGSRRTHECLKLLNLDLYHKYKKFLSETCRELNINFYDCNDYFSKDEFNKKWLFIDRVHLTDLGNKLISEFIKNKI